MFNKIKISFIIITAFFLIAAAKAYAGEKSVYFLTIDNFSEDRRGGWIPNAWTTRPNNEFPDNVLIYTSNTGDATTDIYIEEAGKYQISAYYRTHATDIASRWFQVGVSSTANINYGSYRFANFTEHPTGGTAFHEGWDAGYATELNAGKNTVGIHATTLGSKVRCAAVIIYKLDDGEVFDPQAQYTELFSYLDSTPPENFINPPSSEFLDAATVKISWDSPIDTNTGIGFYQIFKNDIFYKTIGSDRLSEVFENLELLETYNFKVVAYDRYFNSNSGTFLTVVCAPFYVSNVAEDFIFTDESGNKLSSIPAINGRVKVKLNLSRQMPGTNKGMLIFGLYNEDNLIIDIKTLSFEMDSDNLLLETDFIEMTEEGHIFRAFIWDDIDNLRSLSKVKIELE